MSREHFEDEGRIQVLVDAAYHALGQWRDGATPARKARDLVRERLSARGDAPGSGRDLIKLCLQVGRLLIDAEATNEGRELIESAASLLGPRLDAEPSDLDLRGDLYAVHLQRGESFAMDLRHEEAMRHYTAAMRIAEQVVAEHADDEAWQRRLSVGSMHIAHKLSDQGQRAEAIALMQRSRDLARRLHEAAPEDELRQIDVASASACLAMTYRKMGRWAQARRFLAEASALLPSDSSDRLPWRETRFHIGMEGEKLDQDCRLGIAARLLTDDPRHPKWSAAWMGTSGMTTSPGCKASDWAGCLTAYEDDLSRYRRRALAKREHPDDRRDMSLLYERIGHLHAAMGEEAEGLAAFETCRTLRDDAVRGEPDNATWLRDLALIQAKLGLAARLSGDEPRAREALTSGRAAVARLMQLDPAQTAWADDLDWFDRHLSNIRLAWARLTRRLRRSGS